MFSAEFWNLCSKAVQSHFNMGINVVNINNEFNFPRQEVLAFRLARHRGFDIYLSYK